jgi:glutamate/tyrosine decarboxylase-like PLP-dependent enzyme
MYVQYDAGLALIRDGELHRATFAARPAYLRSREEGLAGGEPWFADYGTDLSRGFRALKVWATLRAYGSERLGAAITRNCRLAARMGEAVRRAPELELAAPVRSNVVCFGAAPGVVSAGREGVTNARLAAELQLAGEAVFSTTTVAGRTVLRAAITNHRSEARDVDGAVEAVARRVRELRAAAVG